MILSYKELIVWQKSFQLTKIVYKITLSFPREEIYGLTLQIRRCTVSISSNIAEGFSRRSRKEYFQFLKIALGSATELEVQLLLALELGYVKTIHYNVANELLVEVLKILNATIHKMKVNS